MIRIFSILMILLLLFGQSPVWTQTGTPSSADTTVRSEIIQSLQETRPKISWSLSAGKVFWSIILFVIALFSIKFITQIMEAFSERNARLRLFMKRLIPAFRITVWTIVLYIIIAGVLSPPIETLIAVTASAGIAVGFASQDILKNIFGGIMILFDRPFQVGDKIQVGGHYGEVVHIGLRTVRVVTPDDSLVSIPNSEIVNQSVSNSNAGQSNCQVVAEFYLPADIDLKKTKVIAARAAATSKYIYLNKPIAIIFKNVIQEGRSMIKMRLKAYVLDLRYEFPFASEMTEILISELLKQSIITPEDFDFINSSTGKQ
jgi:MscS family membrane protein